MSRAIDILLGEILEAIELVQHYTESLSYEAFEANVEKQDSVLRRLEIIGEAVKGIPDELRSAYPDKPWSDISGARDILIHEYFRVDLQFIYRAALSIYWSPAEALLDDRSESVESSGTSAARIARALREEYGVVLRPSENLQWKDISDEEQLQVATALFG